MDETPPAAPWAPAPLRTELVAEEVDSRGVVGRLQCTIRSQTSQEPLGRELAEDAYYGLLHEREVSGQLLLRLDRFGASRVRWELRARAGGRVEWLHDEHGTEVRSWAGEAEFVDFWADLSEQAASDYTARLLGLPGAGSGAGLALSGQFALGALRGLAVRGRRRHLEVPKPPTPAPPAPPAPAESMGKTVPTFVPRQLKLILPPAAPLVGSAEPGFNFQQRALTEQPSVKLILPPWPAPVVDEHIGRDSQKVDPDKPTIKVLLPPCLPSQESPLEAWHRSEPAFGQEDLRIALFA